MENAQRALKRGRSDVVAPDTGFGERPKGFETHDKEVFRTSAKNLENAQRALKPNLRFLID